MKQEQQVGFTLIETLIAMAIFTIGILGLFGMQTAAITENLAANTITTGSTWAADQAEHLIGLDYNSTLLVDGAGTNNGCKGLDDWPTVANGLPKADGGPISSGTNLPIYNIYWNVAQDCTLTDIPITNVPPTDVQRPKHIRIIVTQNNGNGTQKQVAEFNYIKQNVTQSN